MFSIEFLHVIREHEIEKIVKHAQRHLKLKIEDLRLIMSGNIKRLLKMALPG